jgi:hypothetical protein
MAGSIRISDIQLFNTLKKKMGEKEAEELVSYVRESIKLEIYEQVPEIATKDYVGGKIAEAKAELIKWMFIFWIGQVAATFGFILLFLK